LPSKAVKSIYKNHQSSTRGLEIVLENAEALKMRRDRESINGNSESGPGGRKSMRSGEC
jgi:hypothetical protein